MSVLADSVTATNAQGDHKRKVLVFKNIDFTVTPASVILFTPFLGKLFFPTSVRTRTRTIGGTISTQPQFKITDGTNDIVAAATNMNANQGRGKLLTLVTDRIPDNSNPLTLTTTVAAAGTNPVFTGDIIVEGIII